MLLFVAFIPSPLGILSFSWMDDFQFLSSDFAIHICRGLPEFSPFIVYFGKAYENISSVILTFHFQDKIKLVMMFYLLLTLLCFAS